MLLSHLFSLVVDNYQASLKVGGQNLNLDLWDTAGQESFVSIRALSYPGSHCILACYSTISRVTLDNIQNVWIPEIRENVPQCPFVLVGTKSDLKDKMMGLAIAESDALKICKKLKGYDAVQCSAIQFQNKEKSKVDLAFKTAITCALDNMNYIPICLCTVL